MIPKMTIKLELTAEEFNLVLGALGELPAKFSRQLSNKLEIIAQEQTQPKPPKDEILERKMQEPKLAELKDEEKA